MTFRPVPLSKPYIIVVGNEKGGTGKSTVAFHIAVGLLYQGYHVGSIDFDERQATFSRYWENRQRYNESLEPGEPALPLSQHVHFQRNNAVDRDYAFQQDREAFGQALEKLSRQDYIIIDTPGADIPVVREALNRADLLITPMNDSLIDLDLFVRLNGGATETLTPSVYAELVWEQRKERALQHGRSLGWIVLRNRLSASRSRNKEHIQGVLKLLAKRFGFNLAPGFGERVIFRELFGSGRTVMDMEAKKPGGLSLSHVAARQELRGLLQYIPLLPQEPRP